MCVFQEDMNMELLHRFHLCTPSCWNLGALCFEVIINVSYYCYWNKIK